MAQLARLSSTLPATKWQQEGNMPWALIIFWSFSAAGGGAAATTSIQFQTQAFCDKAVAQIAAKLKKGAPLMLCVQTAGEG
jgi:hypothetical protein